MDPSSLSDLVAKKEAIESLLARMEVLAWIFGFIVAIGVAGEAFAGIRILLNNRQLRIIQQQVDRGKDAISNAEIDGLKAKADQAGQQSQSVVTFLNSQYAPRRLFGEGRKAFQEVFSSYGVHKFKIEYHAGNPEGKDLATDMRDALLEIKWDGDVQPLWEMYMTPGIVPYVKNQNKDPTLRRMFLDMLPVFRLFGIGITGGTGCRNPEVDKNLADGTVVIMIGTKPSPTVLQPMATLIAPAIPGMGPTIQSSYQGECDAQMRDMILEHYRKRPVTRPTIE